MTGISFRSTRSYVRDERSRSVHCSIRPHTFAEVTLQLRLYPPSPCIAAAAAMPHRVVCNTLLHLACMPGIVCIAPRNPWKQRVRPLQRDDEKKERERDERIASLLVHASFIYHRPFFLVVHLTRA